MPIISLKCCLIKLNRNPHESAISIKCVAKYDIYYMYEIYTYSECGKGIR